MSSRPDGPSVMDLWRQSGGDSAKYRQLMLDHGMLVPGKPEALPCGWCPARDGDTPGELIPERGPVQPVDLPETPRGRDAHLHPGWLQDQVAKGTATLDSLPPKIRAALAQPSDVEDLRREYAGPSVVRAGYRCVAGGDTCPGHPSKWLMCGVEEPPEHRAARQRTDDEQAALKARTCCEDAAAGPDEDGVVLHTSGCRNRCAVAVPCLDSGGRPGTYPCGATVGHGGDHWVPRAARPGPASAEFTVRHWAADVPLSRGVCGTCGEPVVFNMAAHVVGHDTRAVDPCGWPWPGEPMPSDVKAQILLLRRGGAAIDRALGIPAAKAPALGIEEGR
jgi:hypothetical protein